MAEHRGQGTELVADRQRAVDPPHQGGDGRVGGERNGAGHRLDQDEGEGVDVGLSVQARPPHLLRSGVAGGSEDGAGRFGPGGFGQGAGHPEIGDAHPALLVEEEVGRLDVTMDQAPPVGVVEPSGHIGTDDGGLRRGEAVAGVEQRAEAAPFEELHHQIGRAGVLAPVVDPDDVGVAEGGHHPSLGLEAFQERLVVGEGRVQQLHRHAPTQRHVLGHIDMR